MERRDLLKSAGVGLTVISVGTAGCMETQPLEVTDTDSQSTAVGNIEIIAMVVNNSNEPASGELVTQADIQGGDTYTEREVVTVDGNSSNSYTHTHDLNLSESLSGGQYEYSAHIAEE